MINKKFRGLQINREIDCFLSFFFQLGFVQNSCLERNDINLQNVYIQGVPRNMTVGK